MPASLRSAYRIAITLAALYGVFTLGIGVARGLGIKIEGTDFAIAQLRADDLVRDDRQDRRLDAEALRIDSLGAAIQSVVEVVRQVGDNQRTMLILVCEGLTAHDKRVSRAGCAR